ncbi:MAG TPA: hypothetical protein VK763_02680 [Terriglobales bacterium]|jgi:hypothetical protein|nr:hypothetical protein [Terriglobales bacterium]
MKRTLQAITLAAVLSLATCAIPALGEGPGPPPEGPGPPPVHVSAPVAWSMFFSLIHLL